MNTVTLLCIGDSHTAGYPDYDPLMGGNPESSYQLWLKQRLTAAHPDKEYHLINQGLCGDSSRGVVGRLLRNLETTSFHLVILAGGTNDLGMIGEELIIENLQKGYAACRAHGIPVVAPSIPPISLAHYLKRVTTVNRGIESYTQKHENMFFADWFQALKDDKGFLDDIYNSGDGVHLSVEGYRRIGELMVPIVAEALSS